MALGVGLASPRCASRLARKFHRLGYTPVPENDITPHFRKCRAVVSLKLHLVPHTAARPIGFPKQALCKVAYAGVGRTAVGAPRSRVHALRSAVCAPLWVCLHRGISQALHASFCSVACGQSCCVCPRPPVGLAAARLGSALNCPSAPRGGSLSQRKTGARRAELTRRHSTGAVVYGVVPPHSGVWATRRDLFSEIKVQSFDPSASPVLAKKIRYCLDSGLSLFSLVPER